MAYSVILDPFCGGNISIGVPWFVNSLSLGNFLVFGAGSLAGSVLCCTQSLVCLVCCAAPRASPHPTNMHCLESTQPMVQADLPAIPHSQSTLKEFFFSESLDTASDSINICLEPGIYLQMRLLAPIALPLSHFVVDATKNISAKKL